MTYFCKWGNLKYRDSVPITQTVVKLEFDCSRRIFEMVLLPHWLYCRGFLEILFFKKILHLYFSLFQNHNPEMDVIAWTLCMCNCAFLYRISSSGRRPLYRDPDLIDTADFPSIWIWFWKDQLGSQMWKLKASRERFWSCLQDLPCIIPSLIINNSLGFCEASKKCSDQFPLWLRQFGMFSIICNQASYPNLRISH